MIYETTVVLSESFDEVLARVKDALAAEGFGVLTEVDLKRTMQAKLGKTIESHVIVGACNPQLAAAALDVEPKIGVLLPCNVVVRQVGSEVLVEAMDPGLMSSLLGDAAIDPIAEEARRLIGNSLDRLAVGESAPPS